MRSIKRSTAGSSEEPACIHAPRPPLIFQSPLWDLPRRFSPKLPTDKDWMLNRQHKLQALIHDCVQIGSPKETQNHDHATNEDFAKCEKLQNERQCALTQIALMLG